MSEDLNCENEPITKKKYMDEDEESDDDIDYLSQEKTNSNDSKTAEITRVEPIIGKNLLSYIIIHANNYHYKSWPECFPDGKVKLRKLIFNSKWDEFFSMIENKSYFINLENKLSDVTKKYGKKIFPYAELVFNAFNILSPEQIKVIIMGQDPYPGGSIVNGKFIPQACGFSFSVPIGYPKPMSLNNIYQHLLDHGHIKYIPNTGSLFTWILQGCFMINASLTVIQGQINVHAALWKNFTEDLLSYLSERYEHIAFIVWGASANNTCKNINPSKHKLITSSHPSPHSFNKKMNGYVYGPVNNESSRKKITYPAFIEIDHYTLANQYLESVGKKGILWDVYK